MPPSKSARHVALDGLSQIIGEGRMLSDVVADADWQSLSGAERATAQRLIVQTLRSLGPADHVLGPLLQRQPPLRVLNLLRMATVELIAGGAAYGIVNEAVTLASRNRKTAPLKGMVNAVLRNVTRMEPEVWQDAPVTRLPKWLRNRLVKAWGKSAVAAMEQTFSQTPPVDVSVKNASEEWAEKLGATVLSTRSLRLGPSHQISALPGFEDGAWWVQDAAAALPVKLLGDVTGLRILDICAAPGGKTMQLAASGADVTALDISEKRMARVSENLMRTGLNADLVTADALTYKAAPFDAILLDAPCSATGTIRRHPDLPYVKSQTSVEALVALQRKLLTHCLGLLKPDGRVVFCTCSLLPEEGEQQIANLLTEQPDIKVLEMTPPGCDPAWRSAEGGMRLRPDYWSDIGGMDGFYMAVLQKAGEESPG